MPKAYTLSIYGRDAKNIHVWKENEHPRGQPENKGQFVSGSGSSSAPEQPSIKATSGWKETESSHKALVEAYKDWKQETGLHDMSEALSLYRSQAAYKTINKYLRGTLEKPLPKTRQRAIEQLKAGLDKAKAPVDMEVARGIDPNSFKRLAQLKVGDTFSDQGITSASIDLTVARQHADKTPLGEGGLISISIPKGTPGAAYIEESKPWIQQAGPAGEGEVLIRPNAKFKIIAKSESALKVELLG